MLRVVWISGSSTSPYGPIIAITANTYRYNGRITRLINQFEWTNYAPDSDIPYDEQWAISYFDADTPPRSKLTMEGPLGHTGVPGVRLLHHYLEMQETGAASLGEKVVLCVQDLASFSGITTADTAVVSDPDYVLPFFVMRDRTPRTVFDVGSLLLLCPPALGPKDRLAAVHQMLYRITVASD